MAWNDPSLPLSRKGFSTNFLTKYSDGDLMRPDLYYATHSFASITASKISRAMLPSCTITGCKFYPHRLQGCLTFDESTLRAPRRDLTRAVGWFSEQSITCRDVLSDNGSSYRSGEWRKACNVLDLKPIRTKPYTPRTNGKVERFIKTLLGELASAMPFQTSEVRKRLLPRYVGLYNDSRFYVALGGLSTQQCLQRLLFTE